MDEYTCHYLTDAVHSARAVYHARTLPEAMAMHNGAHPEYARTVHKWVGPTGITFIGMHDARVTLDTYVHGDFTGEPDGDRDTCANGSPTCTPEDPCVICHDRDES